MSELASDAVFGPPRTSFEWRGDGSLVLGSKIPFRDDATSMAQVFRRSAAEVPEQSVVVQRQANGWRRLSYGEARLRVDRIGEWLVRHRRDERPVMVLSGNSIEHFLVTFAAYTAGVPVVPVSTAYSLLSRSFDKLAAMVELVEPAVVFADDGKAYAPALEVVAHTSGAEVVTCSGGPPGTTPFRTLTVEEPTGALEEAFSATGPETIAKILFTSGSTGNPKGVLNTHRMLTSSQAMLRLAWPFVTAEPPVLLDWLPWSHTFGGNQNLNLVVANRGTFYVDEGRPTPELFSRTIANLREVSPTMSFNVPAGYGALVPALEADRQLAMRFFSRLRLIFSAAAALPQPLWERIEKLAASVGCDVPLTAGWGATETGPGATTANFRNHRSDCIGVPLPGVLVKLAPVSGKLEARVKGPNVTPGYYRAPEATERAFDDEGFYCSDDAVQLVDVENPAAGLRMDGRISEDFKLSTGSWVRVGNLRSRLLDASGGLIAATVLTGENRPFVGALVWLGPEPPAAPPLGADPVAVASRGPTEPLAGRLAEVLAHHNETAEGSAEVVRRALVLDEPPSLEAGEVNDKGYINQRACLARRRDLVELLYQEPPAPQLVCWSAETVSEAPIGH